MVAIQKDLRAVQRRLRLAYKAGDIFTVEYLRALLRDLRADLYAASQSTLSTNH